MIERTLISIIAVVFLLSSWWWANRQDATERFYEEQLRGRDAVITQLHILALPQVKGKTVKNIQGLLQTLYPQQDVRHEEGIIFAGVLGIRFSEESLAEGFVFPWDRIKETPSQ
jgi:hypothetical protein